LGLLASRASGAAGRPLVPSSGSGNSKGRSEAAPHTPAHTTRIGARLDQASAAWRVEPTDRRMIDVVGKRDLAQLCPATRRAAARAVSSFAASRRGLAFERAHFSPDPLNGGSPDADGRSRLVNARAAPQESVDRPFRLSVDPRPPDRVAALGAPRSGLAH